MRAGIFRNGIKTLKALPHSDQGFYDIVKEHILTQISFESDLVLSEVGLLTP